MYCKHECITYLFRGFRFNKVIKEGYFMYLAVIMIKTVLEHSKELFLYFDKVLI